MRRLRILFTAILFACLSATAQSDRDFSGSWKLNSVRSEINTSVPAAPFFRVEQTSNSLTLITNSPEDDSQVISIYPLDGRNEKRNAGDSTRNTETKWEGSALLVSTIVSGPRNHTVMERWRLTQGGATLTIKRTLVRNGSEHESLLVYENARAVSQNRGQDQREQPRERPALERSAPERPSADRPVLLRPRADDSPSGQFVSRSSQPTGSPANQEFVVAAGTKVLLRLSNAVNTKHTKPGDRVYLETAAPVFVDGRLVIPTGSTVIGTVTESKRAGRVKGTSELNLEFQSLTLRNGVARDLRSRPSSVDGQNVDRTEGRINGESNKGGDTATVAKTTAGGTIAGTVIGGATGHTGMGAGVGAAAGAAAGLATIFGSRGKDVTLPRGTTMEMVVNWDLRYAIDELRP